MKLNKTAFGLAAGVLWGAALFLATWWIIIRQGTGENIRLLSRFYIGYSPSPIGSLVGLIYGFIHMFIGGYIFAALYNAFSCPASEAEPCCTPLAEPAESLEPEEEIRPEE